MISAKAIKAGVDHGVVGHLGGFPRESRRHAPEGGIEIVISAKATKAGVDLGVVGHLDGFPREARV